MKSKKTYILSILALMLFFISYQGIIYYDQNPHEENIIDIKYDINGKVIDNISISEYEYMTKKIDLTLLDYIENLTKLSKQDSTFLIEQCNDKKFDIFIVLGLMKVESNFDSLTIGSKGEKGLGQLMENTAKPVSNNLGYEYDSNKLFEPQYNIELFMTQLKYLYEFYNNDIHKTLTAYNRGQSGLQKYIASRESTIRNPAISEYSMNVISYGNKYKNEFDCYEQ